MRVFVTGATGWVGRALVPELIAAGHEVEGLARTDAAAEALAARGAEVRRGSLDELPVLSAAAEESDAVVHLAFKHDVAFTGGYAAAADADARAVEALAAPLRGSGRALVIASGILGVLGLAPGVVATERDGRAGGVGRIGTAQRVLALADEGVRAVVVRLPPATHGDGDNGFIASAVRFAREAGAAAYVGEGANRWPAVHREDAARLFARAVEAAPAGTVLHAVGEQGVRVGDVARAIGAGLGIPVVSVPAERAGDYVGWLGHFWGVDGPASSSLTRELTGWAPRGAGLLADLAAGHYFA